MKTGELVTIVVPVYNGVPYIQHCVEQLKAQSYTNIEVIFVNDGSKDDTAMVCSEAIKGDNRFLLINKENGGTSTARNAGIESAHGKYIAFFDCDDEYDSEMISILVAEMEKHNADMVSCGYFFKVQCKDDVYLEEKSYPSRFFPNFEAMKYEYVDIWDSDMFYNIWNKLYRMDVIKANNLRYRVGHVYTEDRVFNRAFIKVCKGIVLIDKCLYYYVRERAGSTSERYWDKNFEVRVKEYNELKEHFKEMDAWDEKSREYVSREFIERVAGCIENVFHADKQLSTKQKYTLIKEMIDYPDVREASKYAECRSRKMKIIAAPIKNNMAFESFFIEWVIYLIRKNNPVLFHKMKGKR
ncbi:MAG: glycosyltransferase family 2 protein [Butyrivibrio sp.]|nr:glycosyltransferase family 2 protein [Butyrivibrio sp.]